MLIYYYKILMYRTYIDTHYSIRNHNRIIIYYSLDRNNLPYFLHMYICVVLCLYAKLNLHRQKGTYALWMSINAYILTSACYSETCSLTKRISFVHIMRLHNRHNRTSQKKSLKHCFCTAIYK